jgi:transposase-like protein
MAHGKSPDPKREQLWRRHLQRQQSSGLTARDYCACHDLHESAFYFWRRTIAERDRASQAKQPPAFVPVTAVETAPPADAPIDVRLRGGQRLRVRAGCDRRLLADLVALLEGRPC